MIYVIAYAALGLLTNFMDGYCRPRVQEASGRLGNSWVVASWPLRICQVVGNFGAAVRIGWSK